MFETVISAPVVAAVAVHAANGVPGVRVQPGLADLVGSVARVARQRIKGLDPAPTEGVRVGFAGNACASVELEVVISGQESANSAARAVQQAVANAVLAATGLVVTSVRVSILDIEMPGWVS